MDKAKRLSHVDYLLQMALIFHEGKHYSHLPVLCTILQK
jgi:hypothetical protein